MSARLTWCSRCDHLEQAAQLGAALLGQLGARRVISSPSSVSVTAPAATPSRAPARSSRRARASLDARAPLKLGCEHTGERDDRGHIAGPDRRALLEHDLEQTPGGGELDLEMGENVVGQASVDASQLSQGAHLAA